MTGCAEEPAAPSRRQTPPAPAERETAAATGSPNVVVIMTDDQTVESMRVMPQTVQLIGSAGVTFANNMVTYALCCPSRATFLTGQYPHNHGVRNNTPPEGGYAKLDHSNTLPVWLQAAGYVTGHVGKYLNRYGSVDPLEIPPGWSEWYAAIGSSAEKYFDYMLNENGTIVSYGSSPEEYQTDVYTAKAVDFIQRHAASGEGGLTPFFLFVGYAAPHVGTPIEPGDPSMGTPVPAPRHKGRFANQVLPATPAFNEADMSDKPASMRRRPLLTSTQVSEIGETYRQRLESLLAVDEGVQQIVGALGNAGVLENTLFIFTSDNGFYHGEHRIDFGKVLPYEPAVKVPLLIRGPGIPAGRRVSALVANIDLAPTIVAAAGATPGRVMDGRSLNPFLTDGQTAWFSGNGPRHVLVEDSQVGTAATRFWSIKRAAYVYTEYDNGNRELYDLRVDSAQVASRHADAGYAKVRRQLATRLAAIKACSGPTACW
jgi:N-acetylglucosamine-6-sulfatase